MTVALVSWLLDPWRDEISRRALIEVALLGVAGGAIGCWVLFYDLAYSAESLAHSLLPGLVGASLLGLPLLLGGAAGILAGALGVALAGRVPEIGRDNSVAVVVTTMFGGGVLLALSPDTPAGLSALLFGDVLGVSDGDLLLAGALVAGGLGVLWATHSRLMVVGFDRSSAGALGVRAWKVDALLLALLACALLVAVQGLGNLLVVAVLIAPAAAARLVARRMPAMIATSGAIAIVAGAAGVYLSYHAGTAAGASIALTLVAAYLAVAAFAALRR